MKRTNVILDEELLEKARRVSGERTYSATINAALKEFVRKRELLDAFDRFAAAAQDPEFFDREYVEQMWPDSAREIYRERERVSASERRLPRKRAVRRGSR